MLGRAKCKILKEIRQKIADENDIPYVTRECTFQGNCSGTCPRCESELRYLERELEARARVGKKVAVTALCAGIAMGSTACSLPIKGQELGGDVAYKEPADTELGGAGQPLELEGEARPEDDELIELSGEVEALPEDLAGAAELWDEDGDGCVSEDSVSDNSVSENSVSDNAVPAGEEESSPEAEN